MLVFLVLVHCGLVVVPSKWELGCYLVDLHLRTMLVADVVLLSWGRCWYLQVVPWKVELRLVVVVALGVAEAGCKAKDVADL